MFSVLTSLDIDLLIADTEAEIRRVIEAHEDEHTGPLYEMVRYHMGLDGARGEAGSASVRCSACWPMSRS